MADIKTKGDIQIFLQKSHFCTPFQIQPRSHMTDVQPTPPAHPSSVNKTNPRMIDPTKFPIHPHSNSAHKRLSILRSNNSAPQISNPSSSLDYLCAFHRLFGRLLSRQRAPAQLRFDRGVRALQCVQIGAQSVGLGAVLGGGESGLNARERERERETGEERKTGGDGI
jgi:hypothetical protein